MLVGQDVARQLVVSQEIISQVNERFPTLKCGGRGDAHVLYQDVICFRDRSSRAQDLLRNLRNYVRQRSGASRKKVTLFDEIGGQGGRGHKYANAATGSYFSTTCPFPRLFSLSKGHRPRKYSRKRFTRALCENSVFSYVVQGIAAGCFCSLAPRYPRHSTPEQIRNATWSRHAARP